MKTPFAMITILAGLMFSGPGKAQDKSTTTPDKPVKQCLIVAPAFPSPPPPWVKWEVRDSFNLKPENIQDSYKEKDLTKLRKQGVIVLKIDPAGHQLGGAQHSCKDSVSSSQ
jgi:hypothetical protein